MKGFLNFLNPNVKEFLEKHPNKRLVGLYWSLLWRFTLVVYGTLFLLGIFLAGVGTIFDL